MAAAISMVGLGLSLLLMKKPSAGADVEVAAQAEAALGSQREGFSMEKERCSTGDAGTYSFRFNSV